MSWLTIIGGGIVLTGFVLLALTVAGVFDYDGMDL